MPVRLKDVKIKCISILTDEKKPANGLGVILKDDDDSLVIEAKIHKFDPEGFLIIRPMISKVADTDDEYYEDEDLIEASYDAIKNIQKNGGTLFDTNHDFKKMEDVYFVETKTIKEDGNSIWEMKVDIRDNKDLLEKAKAGLVNGVSIAGEAKKVKFKKFQDFIDHYDGKNFISKEVKEEIEKDFNSTLEQKMNNDLWLIIDVLNQAIWDEWYKVGWSETENKEATFKKEFKKIMQQAIKHVGGMSFDTVLKNEKEKPKGEEMEKQEIQSMIDDSLQKAGFDGKKSLAEIVKEAVESVEKPALPTIKSEDGKELGIIEVIESLAKSLQNISETNESQKETLAKQKLEIEELKKGMTENPEPPTPDESLEKAERQRELKEEQKKGSIL